MEKSTTLKDAYQPYPGENYVPTAAARVPTADGKLSMVKTTKAIHIPARPKSQIGLSAEKMGVCIHIAFLMYSYFLVSNCVLTFTNTSSRIVR